MIAKVLLFVALMAVAVSASCPAFGYDDDEANGPSSWGSLCPEYAACKTGSNQSPIDLDSFAADSFVLVDILYRSQVDAAFSYAPNALSLDATTPSSVQIVTDTSSNIYKLQGVTFHHRSEHTIDGEDFELEVQFHHKADDGALVSFAYFIEGGGDAEDCRFLSSLLESGVPTEDNTPIIVSSVIPQTPTNGAFLYYTGSLTAPPCTEGVTWYVQREPIQCAESQIREIRDSVGDNARSQFDATGRVVRSFFISGATSLTVGASLISFFALFFLMF